MHSYKRRKDSLESSPDRLLFAIELEFPKILVPRLPQNLSNVNTERAGKRKQLYSLCDELLRALIYLHFIILILICFSLIMPVVNYMTYGCSCSRTTPGVITNYTRASQWRKTLLRLLLKIG